MEFLYVDSAIAVCVKPIGVDSEHGLPTLAAAQLSGAVYPVQRLDTPVGGVIVLARTEKAAASLSRAVQEKRLKKEYRAVVSGRPPEGVFEDLLFWDSRARKSYVVKRLRKGVKPARLHAQVLAAVPDGGDVLSLLRVELETGRTHQIRVQCAARRHPLLGDSKYGSRDHRCTTALWSYRLTLPHPDTGEALTFTAPMPPAFPFSLFSE